MDDQQNQINPNGTPNTQPQVNPGYSADGPIGPASQQTPQPQLQSQLEPQFQGAQSQNQVPSEQPAPQQPVTDPSTAAPQQNSVEPAGMPATEPTPVQSQTPAPDMVGPTQPSAAEQPQTAPPQPQPAPQEPAGIHPHPTGVPGLDEHPHPGSQQQSPQQAAPQTQGFVPPGITPSSTQPQQPGVQPQQPQQGFTPQGFVPPNGAAAAGESRRARHKRNRLILSAVAAASAFVVIGGWFGYTFFIAEDKVPVLEAYESYINQYNEAGLAHYKYVIDAALPDRINSGDIDTLKKSFEDSANWTEEELEDLKEAFGSYNKRRGGEFTEITEQFIAEADSCWANRSSMFDDTVKISGAIAPLQIAVKDYKDVSQTLNYNDHDAYIAEYKKLRPIYDEAKTNLENLSLSNEAMQSYNVILVEKINRNIGLIDEDTDSYNTSRNDEFFYLENTIDVGGFSGFGGGANTFDELSGRLENVRETCNGEAHKRMENFYNEFDFDTAKETILEQINPFQ